MIKNNTTDFYHPDSVRLLQVSGACLKPSSHHDTFTLCAKDTGEKFLVGSQSWLTRMCETYRIPLSPITP